MSRFHQDYHDAENLDVLIRRVQYRAMMMGKSEIEKLGERRLAEYRSRRTV